MIYKREKNKLEINGNPKDVKWPMWVDIISNKVFRLLCIILLLCIIPKEGIIPYLWKIIKLYLSSLIPFVVLEVFYSGILSG